MPRLNILGGSGEGRSPNVNASRSINLYPELDADPESKAVISLVKTPGCSLWGVLGAGPNRGQHVFNGLNYVVSGDGLYAMDNSGIPSARLGTLLTVTGRVRMRNNGLLSNGIGGNQIIIVDGAAGYVYDVVAKTFTQVSSPGFPANPRWVSYIDGYFIVLNGTMNAFASELYDGTTWNPLATTPVQASPDPVQASIFHNEQLVFIKQSTTEFYANNGVPTINGFPFSRISGAVIPWGTMSPWSVCRVAGGIFWLASERKEFGSEFIGPVMFSGSGVVPIGTPAINYLMGQWTDTANIFSYSYSENGHSFVVVTSPRDDATLVFDTTTQMWHERSTYIDDPYAVGRHVGNSYVYFNGKHLIGDYQSGNIFQMDSNRLTDYGNPIVWVRRTNHLYDATGLDKLFVNKLQLDIAVQQQAGTAKAHSTLDTGVYPEIMDGLTLSDEAPGYVNVTGTVLRLVIDDPGYDYMAPPAVAIYSTDGNGGGAQATCIVGNGQVQSLTLTDPGEGYTSLPTVVFADPTITPSVGLSYSKDGGHTYGNERIKQERFIFWKLGAARDKVWQIRGSDPVKVVLLGGYAEVEA